MKNQTKIPLVSVIINCYNGEKFLKESIESVLNQSYNNWELIFWDNQSTDNSASIIKSYKDKRIKYFYSKAHTKLYHARNLAFERTSGEFVMFLDSDDYFLSNCLQAQLKLFESEQVDFACADIFLKDQATNKISLRIGKKMPDGHVLSELLKNYSVALPTLIIRKNILLDLKVVFNDSYNYIGDFDLVIRLAAKFKMARNNNPVSVYRIHDNNLSFQNYNLQAVELEEWYEENKKNNLISSNKNYKNIFYLVNYKKLIHAMNQKNKHDFFYYLGKVPWSLRKIRLIIIFFFVIVFRYNINIFKF